MKKILVALLIAVMSVGVANAQFKFGVKAGVNVNHLSLKNATLAENDKAGWTAGVMTEFQVPVIGLCLDLSLMYARLNNNDGNNNFLMVPLNVKYKFSLPVVGRFLAPYLFTGPSFDFKLNKSTLSYYKTKTFQAVWNVGLGVELIKHVQIGASYGFGINNIAKVVASSANPVKLHNNYWTISAAYLF
ncbi:MAG: porin family protein [Muribaculaceae bacterium]|nr:porin family protein [Muribaculaceae bacterium]